MAALVITEKTTQANEVRAAVATRYGVILPAEGHLLGLKEPDEIKDEWKKWGFDVLIPPGVFYPTKAAAKSETGKRKLAAIKDALKSASEVTICTDPDREGQLIGEELLRHYGFKGPVWRVMYQAPDPKTVAQAFAARKKNEVWAGLGQAALARQQADQIFNLTMTRAATVALRAGTKGTIGIGRVKTPTLGIVCLREMEIVDFNPEDYFTIEAEVAVLTGAFRALHAPKDKIKDGKSAEAIAATARGFDGPLAVAVERKRQGPPKLHDLPSLQKKCSARFGWSAKKTLELVQVLYEKHSLLTYPRAEGRWLPESATADVPVLRAALGAIPGFEGLAAGAAVIRKGKSGHFCDKCLEGSPHFAIVPNVNVADRMAAAVARLGGDELKLFDLVARTYLASMLPDWVYDQTTASFFVTVHGVAREFVARGRVTVETGWKEVWGESFPKENDDDQDLPAMKDGTRGRVTAAAAKAKRTEPPSRYTDGTLIEAMISAWKFVSDPATKERLKKAKGIGTSATRVNIIEGLVRQGQIYYVGKTFAPTADGMALFKTLLAVAPELVDPGTTALWEMRLDEIVAGKATAETVVKEIAAHAARLVEIFRRAGGAGAAVASVPRSRSGKPFKGGGFKKGGFKRSGAKPGNLPGRGAARNGQGKPTDKMVGFAESLARKKGIELPAGARANFGECSAFISANKGP